MNPKFCLTNEIKKSIYFYFFYYQPNKNLVMLKWI
jgi:hypothetical protein